MTVAELIQRLQDAPPDAEVRIDRGGAYDTAKSVEILRADGRYLVYISDEDPR